MLPGLMSLSSCPGVVAVYIILKIDIVRVYLILPLSFMTSSFNILMVVVIRAAIDFWIVKNLPDRLMVEL